VATARICKRLRSLGIDFNESILPAYVAWLAGTSNRVVVPTSQAGNRFLGYLTFTNSAQMSFRYTHKTSGFKTSGFKTSGFKTSETSGLQNVRFTKRQVYKMSGLQNVRSSKRPVANNHIYSALVVVGNPQVLLQPCLQAK
jgi:hypothetical protein